MMATLFGRISKENRFGKFGKNLKPSLSHHYRITRLFLYLSVVRARKLRKDFGGKQHKKESKRVQLRGFNRKVLFLIFDFIFH